MNYVERKKSQNLLTDRTCRTCLKPEASVSIFSLYEAQNDSSNCSSVELASILTRYTDIYINKDDNLPDKICETCIVEVGRILAFKKQCQYNDGILRNQLKDIGENVFKFENNCTDDADYELKQECYVTSCNENDSSPDEKPIGLSKRRYVKRKRKDYDQTSKKIKSKKNNCDNNLKCSICSKVFKTEAKLKQHQAIHNGAKPFVCEECGQAFNKGSNLHRHRLTHTGAKPHQCSLCPAAFTQFKNLDKHVRSRHTGKEVYKCSKCGESFFWSSQLDRHVKVCEGILKPGPPAPASTYQCPDCGKQLASKDSLRTHSNIHSGERTFLCSECGVSFSTLWSLWQHGRRHSGERPYVCQYEGCGKAFRHSSTLTSHGLTHTGEKPYKCSICSKAFTQTSHLRYHSRTHTGVRAHTCPVCGKSFKLNGTLTQHMRTHTGNRPHVCNICRRAFYEACRLRRHRQKVHGVKDKILDETLQKVDTILNNEKINPQEINN